MKFPALDGVFVLTGLALFIWVIPISALLTPKTEDSSYLLPAIATLVMSSLALFRILRYLFYRVRQAA